MQTKEANRKLANKACDEYNNALLDFEFKKCPIFKRVCLGDDCHSFIRGRVQKIEWKSGNSSEVDEITYKVHKPQCSNAIVTGTIEYQEP